MTQIDRRLFIIMLVFSLLGSAQSSSSIEDHDSPQMRMLQMDAPRAAEIPNLDDIFFSDQAVHRINFCSNVSLLRLGCASRRFHYVLAPLLQHRLDTAVTFLRTPYDEYAAAKRDYKMYLWRLNLAADRIEELAGLACSSGSGVDVLTALLEPLTKDRAEEFFSAAVTGGDSTSSPESDDDIFGEINVEQEARAEELKMFARRVAAVMVVVGQAAGKGLHPLVEREIANLRESRMDRVTDAAEDMIATLRSLAGGDAERRRGVV